MKFIYADCLDFIDPNYDFLNDRNGEGREKYWGDQFSHEYMDTPPYDGLLVSRGIVGDHLCNGKYSESECMRFRREGARVFLRYTEERYPGSWIFGDCGAFQYSSLPEPPYTPEDMVEFYADGRFTHGCSIDHIIFDFDPELDKDGFFNSRVSQDARRRYEITLHLAEECLRLSTTQLGEKFSPVGVVQGWSPMSMARAAQSLVGMGYRFLAIGGLVPLRVEAIHRALDAIRNSIPPHIMIHLLGFAKADQISEFFRHKITSFDSSSPMIRAFKDGSRNYYHLNGSGNITYYKAIRIPQALENNTIKKKIKTGRYIEEDLLQREKNALSAVREYAENRANLDDALTALRVYSHVLVWNDTKTDEQNNKSLDSLMVEYRRTLYERPWENCTCRVCRMCGVEVVIFRSSNRNKRRGMHNLGVFYNQLRGLRERNGCS